MFIKLAFNRILSIVLLLCSFFMVPKITAQEEGGPTVKVQFKVLELGITKLDKKVDPVFKFYLGKEDGVLLNGTGTCYKFSSKSSTKSFVLPDPAYPGWEVLKPFSVPILSRPAFTLTMECFSNDKGGACTFDKKDDYHSITSKLIDLNAFTPGDYSDTIRISDRDNKFWSLVEFRYTLLRPNNIRTTSGLQAVNLANKMITLSTAYELVNKERLRFTWEYSEDKGNTWSRLAGSKEDPFKLIIDPLKDLFDEHLVTTKEILFRFRVNSRDTFTISDTFKTAFTPLPPSFQKDNVKVTQTCSGRNNGSIKIRNIQTVCNKAYYLLRLASEEAVACQLSDPASMNCSGIVKSGTITNGMIDIKQLPAEAYTLFLYNGDIPIGDIYSKHHFTIESYQKLSIEKVVSRNPSCMDEKAGQIWVQAAGGSTTDLWSVSLTPKQGLPDLNLSDKQIGFKNLLEGSYALEVIDGCGEREVRNFELKKPEKLVIDKITVKKSPQLSLIVNVKNGSGHYKVILSDRFHSVRTIDSTVNLILVLPAKGSFNIKIIDKADPQCLTVDTTYEVAGIFHQPYSIKEGMSLVAIRAVQAQSMPIIGRVNALPLLCLTRVYPSFRAGGISRDNALC